MKSVVSYCLHKGMIYTSNDSGEITIHDMDGVCVDRIKLTFIAKHLMSCDAGIIYRRHSKYRCTVKLMKPDLTSIRLYKTDDDEYIDTIYAIASGHILLYTTDTLTIVSIAGKRIADIKLEVEGSSNMLVLANGNICAMHEGFLYIYRPLGGEPIEEIYVPKARGKYAEMFDGRFAFVTDDNVLIAYPRSGGTLSWISDVHRHSECLLQLFNGNLVCSLDDYVHIYSLQDKTRTKIELFYPCCQIIQMKDSRLLIRGKTCISVYSLDGKLHRRIEVDAAITDMLYDGQNKVILLIRTKARDINEISILTIQAVIPVHKQRLSVLSDVTISHT